MSEILAVVVSNVLLAAALALAAVVVTRFWRSPQLAHALWALVLLKLITPPLAFVPIPPEWSGWNGGSSGSSAGSLVEATETVPDVSSDPPERDGGPPDLASGTGREIAPEGIADSAVVAAGHGEGMRSAPAGDLPPTLARHVLATIRTHWSTILAAAWCLGALVYSLVLLRRFVRFRRVLDAARDPSSAVAAAAARLASKLGLKSSPAVRVVDAPIPPLVWSLGVRPIVLLPTGLLDGLDAGQRDAVIAHELAHVRRRDDLVRWLEVVSLVVFWWNPIAWIARSKLREAEEECCDAWVVWALPGRRRSYGEAMLKTIEFLTDRRVPPVLAGSAFGRSFYKRRIEMIMKGNVRRRMSWSAFLVATMAFAILPVAAQIGSEKAASDTVPEVIDESEIEDLNARVAERSARLRELESARRKALGRERRFVDMSDGDADSRRTLRGLEGTWVVGPAKDGQGGGPGRWSFDSYRWRFDTEAMKVKTSWKRDGQTGGGENRFTIDVTTTPHQLTVYGDNMLIQAIFALDGNQLRLAHFGKAEQGRPRSFDDDREDLGPRIEYLLKKAQAVSTTRRTDDVVVILKGTKEKVDIASGVVKRALEDAGLLTDRAASDESKANRVLTVLRSHLALAENDDDKEALKRVIELIESVQPEKWIPSRADQAEAERKAALVRKQYEEDRARRDSRDEEGEQRITHLPKPFAHVGIDAASLAPHFKLVGVSFHPRGKFLTPELSRPRAVNEETLVWILLPLRDMNGEQLAGLLSNPLPHVSFESPTGELLKSPLAHDGRWLGKGGPAVGAGEPIMMWSTLGPDGAHALANQSGPLVVEFHFQ